MDRVVRQSSSHGPPPKDRNGIELHVGDRCRDEDGVEFVIDGIGWNPPGNVFEGHKGRRASSVEVIR